MPPGPPIRGIRSGRGRNEKRDERLPVGPVAPHQPVFDAVRIGLDAAGFDLLGGGALEAEIARREVRIADADRRTEGAAGEGAVRIQLAAAGLGIEDRAGEGRVVLEVRIGGVVVRQLPGRGVPWKLRDQDREERSGALDDRRRPLGIVLGELGETPAEPRRVETVDRKRTVAAPGAPRAADETVAGAARGLGHGVVDDLEKPPIGVCKILPAHRSRG